MENNKICGIYCIENIINHKRYIGQSVNIRDREYHHFNSLSHGIHHNEFLQKDYDIYGKDNFVFYIVQECEKDMLDWYEIFYINRWNLLNAEFGYNINPGGAAPHLFSELELQKRSNAIKNKWDNMDDNMRNHILDSLQSGYQKWLLNLTQEEKDEIYRRRTQTMLSKSEEEWTIINKKRTDSIRRTVLSRSEERKQEVKENYKKSSKQRWDNTPSEIKEKLRQCIIRSVYCPQLDKIFESLKEASDITGVPSSNIVKVCKGERNFAGKLSDGTKLTWTYI